MKNGDIVYVVFGGAAVLEAQMVSDFFQATAPWWRKKEICRIRTLRRYDLDTGWMPPKDEKIYGVSRPNTYPDRASALVALEEARQKKVQDYRAYYANAKQSLNHVRREMIQLQRRLRELKALNLEQHFLETTKTENLA
jgi:hypothetical protein